MLAVDSPSVYAPSFVGLQKAGIALRCRFMKPDRYFGFCRPNLLELGKIIKGGKPKKLEKCSRRLVEIRPAQFLVPACDANEGPLQQLAEYFVAVDTPDRLDFGPHDWLSVGDDGEGFEHGLAEQVF